MALPRTVYVATDAGFYYTNSFSVVDPVPWTQHSTGLASTNIRCMSVDPFVPEGHQYVCADGCIYLRESGEDWVSILTTAQARTITGNSYIVPCWVHCDTLIPGVVWAYAADTEYRSDVYHFYWLRSADYGSTWTAYGNVGSTSSWGMSPGSIAAHGDFVVAAANRALLTVHVYRSLDGGSSWYGYDSGSSQTVDQKVSVNPLDPTKGYLMSLFSSQWRIVYIHADGVTDTGIVVSDVGPAQAAGFWFSADDPLHMRLASHNVLVYTHDGWATANSNSSVSKAMAIAPVVDRGDENWIILGRSSGRPLVVALESEDSSAVINCAGTNWDTPPYTDALPSTASVAHNGVYAVPVNPNAGQVPPGTTITVGGTPIVLSGPGLYQAVSMPGHTEIDRAGAMPGDRAAFDVHNYPEEHASDTHEGESILHLDPDAAAGEGPVMGPDGKYLYEDIATQDELDTHEGTPDAHHDPVTLGVGSDAALSIDGQEITLADVLTPAEHTAIGDSAPHHAPVTLDPASDAALELSGQTLKLTMPEITNKYRQYTYVDNGDSTWSFVVNGDGMPVFAQLDTE